MNVYSVYEAEEPTIEEAFDKLHDSKNPFTWRHMLCSIAQLYADGTPELDVLDEFNYVAASAMPAIHQFGVSDFDSIGDRLRDIKPTMVQNAKQGTSDVRYLKYKPRAIPYFLDNIAYHVGKVDALVSIPGGGFETGWVAMNRLCISRMNLMRYSHLRRKDTAVQLIGNRPQTITDLVDQRVLVVDDVIASGESMYQVMKRAKNLGAAQCHGLAAIAIFPNIKTSHMPELDLQSVHARYLSDAA